MHRCRRLSCGGSIERWGRQNLSLVALTVDIGLLNSTPEHGLDTKPEKGGGSVNKLTHNGEDK